MVLSWWKMVLSTFSLLQPETYEMLSLQLSQINEQYRTIIYFIQCLLLTELLLWLFTFITELEVRYNGYGYKIEVEQNLLHRRETVAYKFPSRSTRKRRLYIQQNNQIRHRPWVLVCNWVLLDEHSLGVDCDLQASLDEEYGGLLKVFVAWVKKIVKQEKCKDMGK